MVAAVKGYRCIITLPEKMSAEKVSVLRALGAEIVRTPTEAAFDAPESHIGVAKRLQAEIPNSHILDQYTNVNNPRAHEFGTAEEIWEQCGGKVDAVVAGAGTGGTITGIAKGIRKHNPNAAIIAADPFGSILAVPETLNASHESYKVEGIGYDFIPDVLNQNAIDSWIKTNDKDSFLYARRLIREEGLLCGGSTGSAFAALVEALQTTNVDLNDPSKTIVVVCPDSVRNYLTKFVDDTWMKNNDFEITPPASPHIAATPTLRDLDLKPVVTVNASTPASDVVQVLQDNHFDQLPVLSDSGKLIGLVTLGNLLSYISRGRLSADAPVKEFMFNFTKIKEVVTDSSAIGTIQTDKAVGKKRQFEEVTLDTPISALERFFEHNSAALVTERDADGLTVKHIVTKVDLLAYLVKHSSLKK